MIFILYHKYKFFCIILMKLQRVQLLKTRITCFFEWRAEHVIAKVSIATRAPKNSSGTQRHSQGSKTISSILHILIHIFNLHSANSTIYNRVLCKIVILVKLQVDCYKRSNTSTIMLLKYRINAITQVATQYPTMSCKTKTTT